MAGPQGVSREKLHAILWPDSDSDRAVHSLAQALYATRRAIGRDDLFLTGAAIRLNPARITTDVAELDRALADSDFETAVNLHRGPFLDGFVLTGSPEFEQWSSVQRVGFEERVVAALDRLAAQSENAGDYRAAAGWRKRRVAMRPVDSDGVARLLVTLAKAGDRGGALQHAQAHEKLLRDEFDLEPDAAFGALVRRLREVESEQPAWELEAPQQQELATIANESPEPATPAVTSLHPVHSYGALQRWLVAAAFVILAAGGLRSLWSSTHTRRLAVRSAGFPGAVVVVPFSVSGATPAIAHLRFGLAQTLAERMGDDVASSTVDPAAVFDQWRAQGLDSVQNVARDSVLRFARAIGGMKVVVGNIVGTRARVLATTTLLSVPAGQVLATATAEASADSIGELTEKLTRALLVSEADQDPALASPTSTSHSLRALRAFLVGRTAFGRGQFGVAARFFDAALVADSGFALAALDLATAADRLGDADRASDAIARAWAYRARLDAPERARLMAVAGPRYPDPTPAAQQLAAWEGVVRAKPRDAESWYELALRLVRDGSRFASRDVSSRAIAALNRALVLAPTHTGALNLLAQLKLGGPVEGSSTFAPGSDDSEMMPFLAWRAAVVRGDSEELTRLRERFPSFNRSNLRAIALSSQYDAKGLDDGQRAVQVLVERSTRNRDRVDAVLGAHSIALNQGNAGAALEATNQLHELRPDSHAHLRLRILDALYGGGDTSAAVDAVRELARTTDATFAASPLNRGEEAADGCALGQWRLSHHDTLAIGRTVQFLRRAEPTSDLGLVATRPTVCAELLEAALAVLTERSDARVRVAHLDSLMLTPAVAGDAAIYAHIAISRMYEALGERSHAQITLAKMTYMSGWPAYFAAALRDEARLAGEGSQAPHEPPW